MNDEQFDVKELWAKETKSFSEQRRREAKQIETCFPGFLAALYQLSSLTAFNYRIYSVGHKRENGFHAQLITNIPIFGCAFTPIPDKENCFTMNIISDGKDPSAAISFTIPKEDSGFCTDVGNIESSRHC
jgi:hypothetical protein